MTVRQQGSPRVLLPRPPTYQQGSEKERVMMKALIQAIRGMSMACSRGDHLGCPGMSCSCRCHK
jgi:hypothetical protein